LHQGGGTADEESMFANGFVALIGKIPFHVAVNHSAVTYGGCRGGGSRAFDRDFHSGGFQHFEPNDGTSQAEANLHQLAHRGFHDALALEIHAVAGLQIFDPPLALAVRDFDVLAADVFVFYSDVIGICAADAEGGAEFAQDRRNDIVYGDAESGSMTGRFHSWVTRTRKLILT